MLQREQDLLIGSIFLGGNKPKTIPCKACESQNGGGRLLPGPGPPSPSPEPPPRPSVRPTWCPNWLQGKPRTCSPRGPYRCCSSLSCRKSRVVVPQSDATLATSSTFPRSDPSDSGSAAPSGRAASPASPAIAPAAAAPAAAMATTAGPPPPPPAAAAPLRPNPSLRLSHRPVAPHLRAHQGGIATPHPPSASPAPPPATAGGRDGRAAREGPGCVPAYSFPRLHGKAGRCPGGLRARSWVVYTRVTDSQEKLWKNQPKHKAVPGAKTFAVMRPSERRDAHQGLQHPPRALLPTGRNTSALCTRRRNRRYPEPTVGLRRGHKFGLLL